MEVDDNGWPGTGKVVDAAANFTAACDLYDTNPQPDRLLLIASALAAVYSSVITWAAHGRVASLPWPGIDETEASDAHLDRRQRYARDLVVPTYWIVASSDVQRGKPDTVAGSIADDLSEIYDAASRLRRSVVVHGIEPAVADFGFWFWRHWGEHAVDALGQLHRRLAAMQCASDQR